MSLEIHLLDCLCQQCQRQRARVLAMRDELAIDARSLASSLASDLLGAVEVATIPGYHVTERPRDHVATPSYRLTRPRQHHVKGDTPREDADPIGAGSWRWSPRSAARGARRLVIDPRSLRCAHGLPWAVCDTHKGEEPKPRVMVKSTPRKTRLADRFVSLECEVIRPRGTVGPFQSDAVRGFIPDSVTCSEGTWSCDDVTAHAAAERRELAERWNRYERAAVLLASFGALDLFYRAPKPRKVKPRIVATVEDASVAPVLAARFSQRDACARALAGDGRWQLTNGASIVRDGAVIRFAVGAVIYRETPAPATATALASWCQRTTRAWHAERATILTAHDTAPAPDDYALADVG